MNDYPILTISDEDGNPFPWMDASGVSHAVAHWMWTLCQQHDVPPSFHAADVGHVTCKDCLALIAQEKGAADDAAVAKAIGSIGEK